MAEEAQLTVKYLSSPKLLRLQLQDAALRRHFLVQVHPHPPNAPLSHRMPAGAPCCRTAPCAGMCVSRRASPAACWPDHPAAFARRHPALEHF